MPCVRVPQPPRALPRRASRWQASRQTVLFYTPDTEPLARRVAAQEGYDIELAHISWDTFQVR